MNEKNQQETGSDKEEVLPEIVRWSDFLAKQAPQHGSFVLVSDAVAGFNNVLSAPEVSLYCDSPECKHVQKFSSPERDECVNRFVRYHFLTYACNNCKHSEKTFAVAIHFPPFKENPHKIAAALKVGEDPVFRSRVSKKISDWLTSDELEIFKKGRRCEDQSMGIGAFGYYRRLVDMQWKKILKKLLDLAKQIDRGEEVVSKLESAMGMREFAKAITEVEEYIPSLLKIDRQHNPLTSLYGALSIGLHEDDDAECLERAGIIRTVLSDLVENISFLLREKRAEQAQKLLAKYVSRTPEQKPKGLEEKEEIAGKAPLIVEAAIQDERNH